MRKNNRRDLTVCRGEEPRFFYFHADLKMHTTVNSLLREAVKKFL